MYERQNITRMKRRSGYLEQHTIIGSGALILKGNKRIEG